MRWPAIVRPQTFFLVQNEWMKTRLCQNPRPGSSPTTPPILPTFALTRSLATSFDRGFIHDTIYIVEGLSLLIELWCTAL